MKFNRNKIKDYCLLFICLCLIQPIINERTSVSAESLQNSFKQDPANENTPNTDDEENKVVTEYICPNGHCYQENCEDGKCGICRSELKEVTHIKKLARRESISEKIAKSLEEVTKERFNFGVSSTGIIQQILNSSEGGNFSAEGSLDLLFLYRPFDYSTLFLDLEGIGGNGPDEFVGSLSGLNDDAGSFQGDNGFERMSVREAWLELKPFKKNINIIAGKIDLTNYFDGNTIANDETTQFITSAFVNNRTLEVPKNAPGMVSIYETRRGLCFRLGMQSTEDIEAGLIDVLYGIGEVGIKLNCLFGLEGNYRLWTKINGGQNDNKGMGISLDQQLSKRLFSFARYGINETDSASIKNAESGGLELHHPFTSRAKDSTALAFGHATAIDGSEEQVVEIYYRIVINDHFAITPSFQTVFDPIGLEGNEVVTLIGVRTQIEF